MNPLVLLLAAGAVLALAGRKPRGIAKCMWSEEHRGLCYGTNQKLFVTSRFGFHVQDTSKDEGSIIFESGHDYPSDASAAQAARAWIDYHLDG